VNLFLALNQFMLNRFFMTNLRVLPALHLNPELGRSMRDNGCKLPATFALSIDLHLFCFQRGTGKKQVAREALLARLNHGGGFQPEARRTANAAIDSEWNCVCTHRLKAAESSRLTDSDGSELK
jgi:hypothetical protein